MDGRTHKRHGWIGAMLAIVVLGLLPAGAQAAGDAVGAATFLHFGKPESIDTTTFSTQTSEYLSDLGPGYCDPTISAWVTNTAWFFVTGNGRQLTAHRHRPRQPRRRLRGKPAREPAGDRSIAASRRTSRRSSGRPSPAGAT